MASSIYLATTMPHCGKSLISLGITELLLRRTNRVGVFRPLISPRSPGERDKNIDLLLSHFDLNIEYEDTYAYSRREAADLVGAGEYDQVMDTIIGKYKKLESQCDFVLCIGSDLVGGTAALEFDFNADVARNLGSPVLIVTNAADRDVAAIVGSVRSSLEAFQERGCQVLGVVANRASMDDVGKIKAALAKELPPKRRIAISCTYPQDAEQSHDCRDRRALGRRSVVRRRPTRQVGLPVPGSSHAVAQLFGTPDRECSAYHPR